MESISEELFPLNVSNEFFLEIYENFPLFQGMFFFKLKLRIHKRDWKENLQTPKKIERTPHCHAKSIEGNHKNSCPLSYQIKAHLGISPHLPWHTPLNFLPLFVSWSQQWLWVRDEHFNNLASITWRSDPGLVCRDFTMYLLKSVKKKIYHKILLFKKFKKTWYNPFDDSPKHAEIPLIIFNTCWNPFDYF